jgi:hypothetical protein
VSNDDVPVSGTTDAVAHGLREVIDADPHMILLNPLDENVAQDREWMEGLAADVVPRLGRVGEFTRNQMFEPPDLGGKT